MGFLSKEVCYKNCKLLKEHNPSIDGVTFGRKHGSRKFECWCERSYTGVDTRLPMMEKWITRSLMWINGDGVGASEIKMADADTAGLCYEKCMLRMKSRQDSGVDGVTFGKKTGDRKNECYCEIGMTGTNTKADYAARWMTRSFPTIPFDGSFGRWSLFSKCSKDCGGGEMTRSRKCDSPKPQHGGKNCIGDDTETKECNTQACAVDGAFGKWSNFSECSKACGGGEMTRSRKCDSPKPQNGGKDCVGDTIETKLCNIQNCSSECSWNHYPKTCVQGHNLKKYLGNTKSLTECKSLCMGRKDCLAVEYGVDYKGKGYPQPGDCLLQSSVDTENCDGGYWNLDLHVKPEKECAPKDNDAYAEKVCKGKCVHLKGNCGTMMGCGGQKFNVSKHCPVTCAITCPVISGATSCNADKGCKYYTGATMKHSQGETCSSWCSKHGMDCAGMYDDTGNTCNAKSSHTCGYTGDASDNDWICDCKAKVPEPESSTKYELLPAGLYECPAGAEKITTEDECGSAFKAIKAKYNLNNKRPLYAGDWNHVPAFCSVQRPGDDTPHFNRNTKPSNPKGYSLICKSQVPKDNDAYAEKVCKGKCVHLKGNCGTMMGCGGQKFDVSKHCPVTCAAVDGAFGKWSNFSECSKDCDGGEMTRSRKCDSPKPQNGGKNCVGDEIETKECNTQNCPVDGAF